MAIKKVEKDKIKEFISMFPENLREDVEKGFRFLFIENDVLFVNISLDRNMMRKNKEHFLLKGSLTPKAAKAFGVKEFKHINDDEISSLFLEKAVELMEAKRVEIVMKRD